MMTRALLLLLLFVPSLSWGATIYVDPDCANNGDGTTTDCAASAAATGAKNTFVGLSMSAGNTYAGKGGSSQTLASYQVPASGTDGSPITITSYGTGQFTFNSTSTYALAAVARDYLTFDNVKFTSTATHCVSLFTSGVHLIFQNNTFLTCGTTTQAGIAFEGGAATNWDHILIDGNTFSNMVGRAIWFVEIPTSNSENYDDIVITDNTFNNVGSNSVIQSISISIAATSTATVSNLTISRNTFTEVNDDDASPTHLISIVRNATGSSHEARFLGVNINDNTFTNCGGGISVNNVAVLAGVTNSISRNTFRTIKSVAGIVAFYSRGFVIEGNDGDGIESFASVSYLDGSWIDVDLGNQGFHVRRNLLKHALGNASQDLGGSCIELFGSEANYIYGNVLIGCRYGMMWGDDNAGVSGVPNYFVNNTIIDSIWDGIRTVFTVEQVNIIQNNIIANSGRYGINSLGTGTQTLITNDFWNSTSGHYNSQTAGATDITTNPLLLTNYRTGANSPARRTGTPSQYCADYRTRPCWSPPDIGAFQASSGDQPNTRAVRIVP